MNTYGFVSELGKNVGALEELSILVDWVLTNPTPNKVELNKYIDERLITLTNKQLKEGVKNETISI